MNSCACRFKVSRRRRRARTLGQRCADVAGWLVPGAMFALVPKCPACLAAYIAIGTGIGVSVTVAQHLRITFLVVCTLTLLAVAWRQACRLFTPATR